MKLNIKVLLFLAFLVMNVTYPAFAQIKIGVFADCQYCDCDASGSRYYRNSLNKLDSCISEFNSVDDIGFVVGLGDLIDRDIASYNKVNRILKLSEHRVYNVIGNHDYSVKPEYFSNVAALLGLEKTYYSVEKDDWKFIFLNGNEITFQSADKKTIKKAENMVAELTADGKPNNMKWNGGIDKKQVRWLKKELKRSEKGGSKVVIFCHFPVLEGEIHSLWNNEEIYNLITKYDCVKAWINGHNHAGGYEFKNGIHFITMHGMVETENENSFSVITFGNNKIKIDGYGRETDRELNLK